MNPSITRIHKEVRAILWLWGGLVLLALITLASFDHSTPGRLVDGRLGIFSLLRLAGFLIGIPMLATLALGHEFQHGTIPLLLAQPIDRMRIWREKWLVLIPAVITVAVAYVWNDTLLYSDGRLPLAVLTWIVLSLFTSWFWTLVGRSMLNGLLLTLMQGVVIFWLWRSADMLLNPQPQLYTLRHEYSGQVFDAAVAVAITYSVLLLWLGCRKFVRFEVAGGQAVADILVPRRGAPSFFGRLWRSQPKQPLFNLIRKELRLLWPVWLLAGVAALGGLGLATFDFMSYPAAKVKFFAGVLVISISGLCSILAGSLSMTEERASGTHGWHRTLPLSSGVQWSVKLAVAWTVSTIALLLPFAAAGYAVGADFLNEFKIGYLGHPVFSLLIFSLTLSLAAFWCANVFKGTLRAALMVVPLGALVVWIFESNFYVVYWLSRTDIIDSVLLRLNPPNLLEDFFTKRPWPLRSWTFLLWVPVLVVLIQSFRLFRREIDERILATFRRLGVVIVAAFIAGGVARLPVAVWIHASARASHVLNETHEAIQRLPPVVPQGLDSTPLTVADLLKVRELSPASRILLRDASITLKRAPGERRVGNRTFRSEFSATTRFDNGLVCIFERDFFECKPPEGK
jgi:hypothetical protein